MKLLEDMPSVEIHRATGRRSRVTLTVTLAILVAGALAGVIMLTSSGDVGDGAAGSGDSAADGPPVALTAWVDGTVQACATVVTDHPVLAGGDPARTDAANIAAVDAGTRALATAVKALPLPTAADEKAAATAAVALGDQADQAWYGLAAAPDTATAEQLAAASGQTGAFVAGLVELGAAGCASLG